MFEMKQYDPADLEAQKAILGFQGEFRWMSNFWRAPGITAYGFPVPSVEHGFVIAKIAPDNPERLDLARRIAAMRNPADAKRLGRQIALREDWEEVKYDLVAHLLARKFAPGTGLARKLLATGEQPIFELNDWGDRIWGLIRLKSGLLEGRNAMGELLMARRRALAGG